MTDGVKCTAGRCCSKASRAPEFCCCCCCCRCSFLTRCHDSEDPPGNIKIWIFGIPDNTRKAADCGGVECKTRCRRTMHEGLWEFGCLTHACMHMHTHTHMHVHASMHTTLPAPPVQPEWDGIGSASRVFGGNHIPGMTGSFFPRESFECPM